ncbi:MAG TPA: Hpt domain-containing protein, partial [Kiloniellales bacterium]|nr:Hpt domain-containing protein [Kiloniellales bacterium]
WLAKRAADRSRERAAQTAEAPPAGEAASAVGHPELDLSVLHELAKLDPDGLRDLLQLFAEEGRARLVALKAAVYGDDVQALAGLIHALAGGAASLGALALAAAARSMEEKARAGAPPDAEAVVELERLFDRAVDGLRREASPKPLRGAA